MQRSPFSNVQLVQEALVYRVLNELGLIDIESVSAISSSLLVPLVHSLLQYSCTSDRYINSFVQPAGKSDSFEFDNPVQDPTTTYHLVFVQGSFC